MRKYGNSTAVYVLILTELLNKICQYRMKQIFVGKAQGNFERSPWLQKGSIAEYSRFNFESHTPEINDFTVVEIYA